MRQSDTNNHDEPSKFPDLIKASDTLRDQIFRVSFWSAFGLGGVSFWLIYLVIFPKNDWFVFAAYLLSFFALVIIASYAKTNYRVRTIAVVIFFYLAGLACLLASNLITATSLFFTSGIILAGLLIGKRAVIGLGALAVITLFLTSFQPYSIRESFQPSIGSIQIQLLSVVIYSLIASSAIIPLISYSNKNQSVINEIDNLVLENQQLSNRLADAFNILNDEIERLHSRQENLNNFTKTTSIFMPIGELMISALSEFHNNYSYTHLELFLEGASKSYLHAYLSFEGEAVAKCTNDEIPFSSLPEIVWETIHNSTVVVNSHTETPVESDAVVNITHLWQICIPLQFNQGVVGALLIKNISGDEIKTINRSEIELAANILALKVICLQLAGNNAPYTGLYQQSNLAIHRLSQANSVEEISFIVEETLSRSPFITLHFRVEKNSLHLMSCHDPEDTYRMQLDHLTIPIESGEGILVNTPLHIRQIHNNPTIPSELLAILQKFNAQSAAFLTIQPNSQISALVVLASRNEDDLSPASIQPFVLLASYATTTIEKTITSQHLQRRLIALQSLASISQAISVVTDLNDLYEAIHEQITQVVGEVDLAIAMYDPTSDMISIPYAHEAGEKIMLEPFPLGQGLTSILIRTQQPLMLVEDTERRARELGARIAGAPAKSWLGVPLVVSGEVLGAILLQDIEHEHRFNDDDLRLITTLASQVAITVRNVRLLQESNLRAERERIVSDITSKIWSSPDIESIAWNALHELSRSLQVSEGSILLQSADSTEVLRREPSIREN